MLVTVYKLKAPNGKCYVRQTTNFTKRKSVRKKHSINGRKSPTYNTFRK